MMPRHLAPLALCAAALPALADARLPAPAFMGRIVVPSGLSLGDNFNAGSQFTKFAVFSLPAR